VVAFHQRVPAVATPTATESLAVLTESCLRREGPPAATPRPAAPQPEPEAADWPRIAPEPEAADTPRSMDDTQGG
jgi:hypothetical protein